MQFQADIQMIFGFEKVKKVSVSLNAKIGQT